MIVFQPNHFCPASVRKVIVMGGNEEVNTFTSTGAEFNFWCDPDAAQLVISRVYYMIRMNLIAMLSCLQSNAMALWSIFHTWHPTADHKQMPLLQQSSCELGSAMQLGVCTVP